MNNKYTLTLTDKELLALSRIVACAELHMERVGKRMDDDSNAMEVYWKVRREMENFYLNEGIFD